MRTRSEYDFVISYQELIGSYNYCQRRHEEHEVISYQELIGSYNMGARLP